MTRCFIDQINEDEHGKCIAGVVAGRDAFTLPIYLLPKGVKEGDTVEIVSFRRDNSADLAAVKKLMEELLG